MTICKVDGCDQPVRANGFCRPHNMRNWRYGDPLAGAPSRGHAKQFLLDHVGHTGDDCVIWPYAKNSKGYADIRFNRMEEMLAHRVMCVLAHGQPPEPNLDAAHSCGNGQKGCINPRHLSWKTRIDNHADKQAHGTQIWGDRVHFAKISLEQARRAKYGGEPGVQLAREFGVRPTTIYNIRNGRTWKGI